MPCNLVLTSSPVYDSAPGLISIAIAHDVIPPRVVVVHSTKDAIAARDEYARECAATGTRAAISARRHPRCRGRKPAGFDAAMSASVFVNSDARQRFRRDVRRQAIARKREFLIGG